ncbi:hypothetical protein QVD17_40484 [Tagetes erecta]|uniref:Mono-/di-acylglycerol lipase N-terminal domain-containing protein n=1 Tax=Tagetes erecta TaxID=13708 RepID=A0AAD8JS61_TARER|nr:hypothetical protein QVD17_40484 [Tagetes erecta]
MSTSRLHNLVPVASIATASNGSIACLRWLWKHCTYFGIDDSVTWPPATSDELEPIHHLCRLILAVYEEDLHRPKFPPLSLPHQTC